MGSGRDSKNSSIGRKSAPATSTSVENDSIDKIIQQLNQNLENLKSSVAHSSKQREQAASTLESSVKKITERLLKSTKSKLDTVLSSQKDQRLSRSALNPAPAAAPKSQPSHRNLHAFELIDKNDDVVLRQFRQAETVSHNGTLMISVPPRPDELNPQGRIVRVTPSKIPKYLAFTALLMAAGVEAADVMTSLIGANKSYWIVFPASAIAFFAQFGLTGKPVQEAVAEVIDILDNKSLPTEEFRKRDAQDIEAGNNPNQPSEYWVDLDYYDELKAIAIGTAFGLWGIYSKGSLAYYLMNTIPGDYAFKDSWPWAIISGIFALGYVTTGLLTESLGFYKFIRDCLAGQKNPSEHAFNKYFSLVIIAPFALINAISDSANSLKAITDTFKINSRLGYWLTAGPSLLFDGGQKLVFEGGMLHKGVYNTLNYTNDVYRSRKALSLAVLVNFFACLAFTLFLEICKQPINFTFERDVASDILGDVTQFMFAIKIFNWLSVLGGILIGTVSLHPEVEPAVNLASAKLTEVKERIEDKWAEVVECQPEEARPLLLARNTT